VSSSRAFSVVRAPVPVPGFPARWSGGQGKVSFIFPCWTDLDFLSGARQPKVFSDLARCRRSVSTPNTRSGHHSSRTPPINLEARCAHHATHTVAVLSEPVRQGAGCDLQGIA